MSPPTLNGTDISGAHSYLADAWPDWTSSMAQITNQGGPWKCETCDAASLLCYRCSKCGADLAGD